MIFHPLSLSPLLLYTPRKWQNRRCVETIDAMVKVIVIVVSRGTREPVNASNASVSLAVVAILLSPPG